MSYKRWISYEYNDQISVKLYLSFLHQKILEISNKYNLLDKYRTGFGWYQNLNALYTNKIINDELYYMILDNHDFFNNLNVRQQVDVDTWNKNVLMQKQILEALN